jgi:hypothetical protein
MTPINVTFLLPFEEILEYHKEHMEMDACETADSDEDDEVTFHGFDVKLLDSMLQNEESRHVILGGVAMLISDFSESRSTAHNGDSKLTLEGMREYLDYNCTYSETPEDAMVFLIATYISSGLGINAIYVRLPANLQVNLQVDEATAHFIKCTSNKLGLRLDVQLYQGHAEAWQRCVLTPY